jgi:hypothetical protein
MFRQQRSCVSCRTIRKKSQFVSSSVAVCRTRFRAKRSSVAGCFAGKRRRREDIFFAQLRGRQQRSCRIQNKQAAATLFEAFFKDLFDETDGTLFRKVTRK